MYNPSTKEMIAFKRYSPNVRSGFWVAALAALWLAFAPTQAGGLASYIIVIGNSMEPGFHIGDLVIVHEEAEYRVGDAVVYRNRDLENFVFHRIIQQELGHFTLQGDNNSWTDDYQPSKEEVLGKLWLHVPKGGEVIRWIRNPYAMAGLAGALGILLATGFSGGGSKGRKRMNKEWFSSLKQKLRERFAQPGGPPLSAQNPNRGNALEATFFALALVAFGSFILGIISFSRPAAREIQDDIAYDQLGFFAYTATAPQGVYDSNAIRSGDPIFPRLTCAVDVTFQYTLVALEAQNVGGAYRLTATISEQASGWQRTVPLQDEASFSGNAFGTTAKLDLCKLEKLAQAMEENTEFHPGSYLLTVSPNVKVDGELSGRVLQGAFNPSLAFRYDRVHFYLARDDEEQKSLLDFSEKGILSESRTEANTLKIFGAEFAIPALRLLAVIGLVASLGGLAYLGMKLQNLSKGDPVQFIRARFGAMMIDIRTAVVNDSTSFVDVSSIDDLGKLAERFNAMILHAESEKTHAYYVQGEGSAYRFVLNAHAAESTVPAEEAERES
jgi:signal peptidase I